MRFSLQFLFMVMAFVAAYFSGRASLMPVIRELEQRDVLQRKQIDSQNQKIEVFEKQKALEESARFILEQNRREKELRKLDMMIEAERAHSLPRLDRPRYLAPDFVPPKLP